MTRTAKIVTATSVLALTLGLAFVATADWDGRGHGARGYGPMQGMGLMQGMGMTPGAGPAGMLQALDTDRDGAITGAEIEAARRDRLAKFDANRDGKLTLEEFRGLWLESMRPHMVDQFQHYDADGDGAVTAEEFGAPFDQMVARHDRNGDGKITAEEMTPRRGDRDDRDDHRRGRHRD